VNPVTIRRRNRYAKKTNGSGPAIIDPTRDDDADEDGVDHMGGYPSGGQMRFGHPTVARVPDSQPTRVYVRAAQPVHMVDVLTPAELRRKLEARESIQVVDIRTEAAFADGHIPGAENVPFVELPDRVDEFDWGAEVVMVCPIGQSSLQAARLLESYEGVDDDARVYNLDGGMDAWDGDLEAADDSGARNDPGPEAGR